MSESDGEQAARSLALEQAYVHEVYEQCADRTIHAGHWPRIYHFLEELEPGALVCDIGCGNGKYLNVNHNVFKIGVDRCTRFTNIAREKENEVLACDNLALPFRDESFDAVLSVAVVHHFSTTERRVRAIKELARVLRIGGRLIISVWAMEQKHRKFESQDVLVPWPKAYCISSSGSPMKPRGMSYDERFHRGKSAQTYLLSKRGSQRNGSKNKSYWVDPIFSPSPSTSSLSSPNETCYSFFRRALQKLAGGRRGSRAWFVENWQNGKREYDDEDDGDVDDLPIELRRLEDSSSMPLTSKEAAAAAVGSSKPPLEQQLSDSLSVKSKSLSNIVEVQRLDLVRSRSSLPGLPGLSTSPTEQQQEDEALQKQQPAAAATHQPPSKPRLVKQKTHYGDDTCLDNVPENTAIKPILQDVPETHVGSRPGGVRRNVHKQSSMNEELMSIERLKERESVRKNIMKQASLNEELIYKSRPTFEAFRDTLYSGSARFQLLKSGLTNRIKQSTTNIEKVSGMSIKNGFVRILQSWNKSTESPFNGDQTKQQQQPPSSPLVKREGSIGGNEAGIERRMSREDGSDSSKDSSLQSDTSVDSEDSFASVIYVPKKSSSPLIEGMGCLGAGAAPGGLSTTSAPPSPRVKYAPELGPARLKLISVSPLLKQFPATSKSLPPPSPPGLSPRTLNTANMRPFFSGAEANNPAAAAAAAAATGPASLGERIAQVKRSFDVQPLPPMPTFTETSPVVQPAEPAPAPPLAKPITVETTRTGKHPHRQLSEVHSSGRGRRSSVQLMRGYRSMSATLEAEEDCCSRRSDEESGGSRSDAIDEALEQLSGSEVARPGGEDDSRSSRLDQIKQLLRAKPGFAARTKPSFPLVRRASSAASCGRLESVGKALPRLLSLELFNPETDDLDSDSSGVSSPESVGSVISVISDERYLSKKKSDSSGETTDSSKELGSCSTKPDELSADQADLLSLKSSATDDSDSLIDGSTSSSHSLRLASVEDSVETTSTRPNSLDKHISPVESTWNEECNRHLIDLTDRLSGTLINDIDQFCRRTKLEFDEAPTNLTSTRYSKQQQDIGPAHKLSRAHYDCNSVELEQQPEEEKTLIQRSLSEDSDAGSSSGAGSFVVVGNEQPSSQAQQNQQQQQQQQQRQQRPKLQQRSIESSDIGDSIENTISESESLGTRRFCTGSTASLASLEPRARLCVQTRSASEEIPRGARLLQQPRTASSNATLSGSSSQESLPSDQITYHQYYHVFREGELDQLINKYVENLHIISSYYDHASWCIVAEKVQVWTI